MKSWLLKIKTFILSFLGKAKKEIKVLIPIGIDIVEAMKKFVDSPTADVLAAIIPGTIDDGLITFYRRVAPGILKSLKNWDYILNGVIDPNEQLKLIINEINNVLPKQESYDLKLNAASMMNEAALDYYLPNEGISFADAKIMTLTAYHYPDVLEDEKTA